jgi:hypothetical protein
MRLKHTRASQEERCDKVRDELIRARIQPATRYAFFFTSVEGRYLPGTKVEETSGYVIDDLGRVHFFWFGWDSHLAWPALLRWRPEAPDPDWESSSEYRKARAEVGLA